MPDIFKERDDLRRENARLRQMVYWGGDFYFGLVMGIAMAGFLFYALG
jgi:hypothetical protein